MWVSHPNYPKLTAVGIDIKSCCEQTWSSGCPMF